MDDPTIFKTTKRGPVVAAAAYERWKRMPTDSEYPGVHAARNKLARQVQALVKEPTYDELALILGEALLLPSCGHCGEIAELVLVGDEPDYESSNAEICAKCLRAALHALES